MRILLPLAIAVTLLAGCGPIYETQYSYYPPRSAEGRQCTNQCKETDRFCAQNCKLEQENCRMRAKLDAQADYNRYVADRQAQRQPIKKDVSDFDRSYNCTTNGCDERCKSDYHGCFRGCGGEIRSHQVCTMFCDK